MDNSIISTLTYFDIFDYPLTLSEIKKYSDTEFDVTDDELRELMDEISIIQESEGFYYLLGRYEIVEKRIERGSISIEKFAKAKIIAKILFLIPTIKYIGVSGSLSMYNSSISDDIDLFFITKNPLNFVRVGATHEAYLKTHKLLLVLYTNKICMSISWSFSSKFEFFSPP